MATPVPAPIKLAFPFAFQSVTTLSPAAVPRFWLRTARFRAVTCANPRSNWPLEPPEKLVPSHLRCFCVHGTTIAKPEATMLTGKMTWVVLLLIALIVGVVSAVVIAVSTTAK